MITTDEKIKRVTLKCPKCKAKRLQVAKEGDVNYRCFVCGSQMCITSEIKRREVITK